MMRHYTAIHYNPWLALSYDVHSSNLWIVVLSSSIMANYKVN